MLKHVEFIYTLTANLTAYQAVKQLYSSITIITQTIKFILTANIAPAILDPTLFHLLHIWITVLSKLFCSQ